jgi:hypothetical protein
MQLRLGRQYVIRLLATIPYIRVIKKKNSKRDQKEKEKEKEKDKERKTKKRKKEKNRKKRKERKEKEDTVIHRVRGPIYKSDGKVKTC